MILIVSDTGPINYLVIIGQIGLLPQLADRIVLPFSVHGEMLDVRAPEIVRTWAGKLPDWIELRSSTPTVGGKGLSIADREAITLARDLKATLLLTDDRKARQCAAGIGVASIGTLGILEIAAERKLISLPDALQKLRATSCFLAEELIEDALNRDRARNS